MGKVATLGSRLQLLESRLGKSTANNSLRFSDPRRGSRHERGYGTNWDKLRLVILKRDGYRCQMCMRAGRLTAARIVDHIAEKADGGSDDPSNLEAICKPCHHVKGERERAKRMAQT